MNILNRKKGFTLVELIIYVGVAAGVMVIIVTISLNVIVSNRSLQVRQEVYAGSRAFMEQFQQYIRASDNVGGSTVFDSNPGKLVLDYPNLAQDVVFDTYTKTVDVGGKSADITKLRFTYGNEDSVDLTTDRVDLTNFVITDLTRASEADNLLLEFTLEAVNPTGDVNYDADLSFRTAISIRR